MIRNESLKTVFGYLPRGHKKIRIEIFKNHDFRVFHIPSGTKKYLLVPKSLRNIQERKATEEEKERLTEPPFSRKRYLYGE